MATLQTLLTLYGDVDFNALRGYPNAWNEETDVNTNRVDMASTALIHFNGSAADLVRWIGGPHVGQHRNVPAILTRLRVAGVPQPTYDHMQRILCQGLPAKVQAFSSERNFQAFRQYGNHTTVLEDPAKTRQALIKDNKKSYTILFDPRLIDFLLNCLRNL